MTQTLPEPSHARPGAQANSPWSLPPKAWWRVLKRVWVMSGFHELGLLAAGLAFYSFLAITPMIAATVMIYGLVGDGEMVARQIQQIVEVVPADVAHVLEQQMLQIVSTSSKVTGIALVVALFFAIFGAMRAANGMISAMNIINEEHETRGFFILSLRAAGLTIAAILIAATGVLVGAVLTWLQSHASGYLGGSTATLFKLLTWFLALALGTTVFAIIMRYAPDRRPAKWRWLTPGSVLATVLWVVVSFGFSLYVAYISDYNATYGSLSAIVVFLMWLYLSAYGVLLGGLLNAEIERQTHRDTTAGPERPPGERGAVLADVIDNAAPSLSQLEERRRARATKIRAQAET